ncbi:MAG: hypothetical protein U1C70_03825, partial [Sediminibacterium sp.]|uniref:hypothetical protein n=1 Tax=Sediminibacterium sp. TaxID=1917865 RepID=UPI002ABCA857
KGERAILFSKFGTLLEGFQLNKKNSFESILRGSINVQFHAERRSVDFQLPEIIHGINFLPIGNYAAWRIVITFGSLPDLFFFDKKFGSSLDGSYRQVEKTWYSDWQFGTKNIEAQQCTIALPVVTDSLINKTTTKELTNTSDTLAIAVGITFGTPITDQLVKTNKYVGAGKILSVYLPSQS